MAPVKKATKGDPFADFQAPAAAPTGSTGSLSTGDGGNDPFASFQAPVGATSASPPSPGFLQRFGEATGIPTTKEQAESLKPSMAEIIGGPAVTGGKMLLNYGKNIVQGARDFASTIPTHSTGSFIEDYANVAKPISKFTNEIMAPFGGGTANSLGEDIDKGNVGGGIGDTLGLLTNALLMKRAKSPSEASSVNKLSFAAGKGTTGDISKTLGDLRSASQGQPIHTVDDFLSTVKRAKDSMNSESGNAMFPIQHIPTVPMSVGQRIRDLIKPNMDLTAAGREAKRQIENAAIEFEKPGWTLGKLDAERMQRNADLSSFYSKSPNARYTAEKGSTNLAIDKAASDAIRDTIYPQMDQAAGKPTGYFADLKRRQGSLIDLESALDKRVDELKDQTARIKGGPRLTGEQVEGAKGAGIAKTAIRAVHQPNPLAVANRRVSPGLATGSKVAKVAIGTLPARYLMMLPDQSQSLPEEHPLAATSPIQ